MTCEEFEIALADYCDDTLLPDDRKALQAHGSVCSGCRLLMEDVLGGIDAGKRLAPVSPPPELITRLAQAAPLRRIRRPAEYQGTISRWLERWLLPVVQPRWAMGMAMTILSFGMLERCTGIPVQHLRPADLSPASIWNGVETRALRVRDRTVKYYENIRFVYEVEMRLHQYELEQVKGDGGVSKQPVQNKDSSPDTTGKGGKR